MALAILGLLLAIVPARLDRLRSRWRLRAAAEEIAATTSWAHNSAALQGVAVQIMYDVPRSEFWIRTGQRAENFRHLPDGVVFAHVAFGSRLVTGDVAACQAYPDGTLDAHEVVLRSDAGRDMRIRFDRLTGEPSYVEELASLR